MHNHQMVHQRECSHMLKKRTQLCNMKGNCIVKDLSVRYGHYSPSCRILHKEIKKDKKKVLVIKTKINEYEIILRLMKTLIGKLFSNILFREL